MVFLIYYIQTMAIGRRKSIINYLVEQLTNINGGTSTYDNAYTYVTNVNNNVYRQLKFLDEVNDYPALYLQADYETRIYESDQLTHGSLPIVIRCYVNSEDSKDELDNLSNDIEHVLYNLPSAVHIGIIDIIIDRISSDEGLLTPYGIGEIFITVHYELDKGD